MTATHIVWAGDTKLALKKKVDSDNPTLQYEDRLSMRKVTLRTESLAERINKTIMDANWGTIYSHNLADHNRMQWGDNFWKNLEFAIPVILILFTTYQATMKIRKMIGTNKIRKQ